MPISKGKEANGRLWSPPDSRTMPASTAEKPANAPTKLLQRERQADASQAMPSAADSYNQWLDALDAEFEEQPGEANDSQADNRAAEGYLEGNLDRRQPDSQRETVAEDFESRGGLLGSEVSTTSLRCFHTADK